MSSFAINPVLNAVSNSRLAHGVRHTLHAAFFKSLGTGPRQAASHAPSISSPDRIRAQPLSLIQLYRLAGQSDSVAPEVFAKLAVMASHAEASGP